MSAMQYTRNTSNALDAIQRGDIAIAKKQIALAQLAAKKRLQAKRDAVRTALPSPAEIIPHDHKPVTAPVVAMPISATTEAVTDTAKRIRNLFRAELSEFREMPLPNRPHLSLQMPIAQLSLLLAAWAGISALLVNHIPHNWGQIWARLESHQPAKITAEVSGYPVDGRITSPVGWRIHPVTGVRKWHNGVDIAAPLGTPLRATGNGVIEVAEKRGACGNALFIDHGTQETRMCHLQRYVDGIKAGVRVTRGQIVGYIGSTGRSTGPHVHYEVRNKADVSKKAYSKYISAASTEFNVPAPLISAVMQQESAGNPQAYSGKAHGLMQLTRPTGLEVAAKLGIKDANLYDPQTSVRLGTAYLSQMLDTFGEVKLALAAYNAGPNAVRKHGGIPPYRETQNYVASIVSTLQKQPTN